MGMRRKKHYHLKHAITDALNLDPKCLGPKMDLLLPSLDPDFKPKKKKLKEGEICDFDSRYVMTEEISNLDKIENEDVTSDSLAVHFPCYYTFYPSDQVM